MDLRQLIVGTSAISRVPVEVPEWPVPGDSLFAKTLTPAEFSDLQERWRAGLPDDAPIPDLKLRVCTVIAGTVDAQGQAVFTTADYDHLVNHQPISAIARLFLVIARLNGLTKENSEAAKKKFRSNGFLRFAFWLANHHRISIGRLMAEYSLAELQAWGVYFELYPPEQREDHRAGIQAAATINAAGGWKGRKPAKAADFFPMLEQLEEEEGGPVARDAEVIGAMLRSRVMAMQTASQRSIRPDPTEDE